MKKVITFGEIMMRLNPPGYQRFVQTTVFEATYAGGEANVAVSLANYKNDVAYVSKVPDKASRFPVISTTAESSGAVKRPVKSWGG